MKIVPSLIVYLCIVWLGLSPKIKLDGKTLQQSRALNSHFTTTHPPQTVQPFSEYAGT